MKKIFVVIGIILAVLLVLSVAKDMIIKISVEKGVQAVTGLPLSMRSFKAGIINTIVDIKGLVLSNPQGFKDKVMLDSPEIYVRYDLPAVISGNIHLQEVRLDLKEFVVVKNEKGQLNLDSLKTIQQQKGAKKSAEKGAEKAKMPSIKIDVLELKIGKAVYKDYSRGGEPSVQEFNVNINEKYTNITDPNTLVALIVFKALMNTTISSLANFNLGIIKGSISDTLGTAEKLLESTTAEAAKALEGATKTTGAVVEGASKAADKAAEGVKDLINALPFGEKKE